VLKHGTNNPALIKDNGDDEEVINLDDISDDAESSILDKLKSIFSNVEPMPLNQTKILPSTTLEGVAEAIKTGICKNIIIMSGAGISVAAGIPDFRSPGTGLYHNLQKYNLPTPESIFDIQFFKSNPKPFYVLAKELYPENFDATYCHYFVRLLDEKGLLVRCYTQNIDTLERKAGVRGDILVEAHGSFANSHCIECGEQYPNAEMKSKVFASEIAKCIKCNGLVKPDITFFGERLPTRFYDCITTDFPKCDLLIVMGTSLKVQPFASLVERVEPNCPRILINREEVHIYTPFSTFLGLGGFTFNEKDNLRDVKALGDCQDTIKTLVDLLGWTDEFTEMMKK